MHFPVKKIEGVISFKKSPLFFRWFDFYYYIYLIKGLIAA